MFYVNESRSIPAPDVDFPVRSYNGRNWTTLPLFQGELLDSTAQLQDIGFALSGVDGSVEVRPTVPGSFAVRMQARDLFGQARMENFRFKDEVAVTEQAIEIRVRPPLSRVAQPSSECQASQAAVATVLQASTYVVGVPLRVNGEWQMVYMSHMLPAHHAACAHREDRANPHTS